MRLTNKEQQHVRVVLRFLHFKVGGWGPLGEALGMEPDSITKVLRGTRDVTARLAYSIARLTDASIDDLLAGVLLPPGTCPHCGRGPNESDFVDEETVVEDKPRDAVLKLVK